MYYIYHIPGIKIGVTKKPKLRVKQQGYSEFEILECHTDIYITPEREIELQKEYGYVVDYTPYWQTIEMQSNSPSPLHKFTKEQRKRYGSIGGKIAGGRNKKITFEQAEIIRDRWHEEFQHLSKHQFCKMVADETGMSHGAIDNILTGITYRPEIYADL